MLISVKVMLNTDHYAVQGHLRSSLSVPVETWKFTFCLAPFPRYRGLLAMQLWIMMKVSTDYLMYSFAMNP